MSFELIDRYVNSRINWGNEFQSVGPATVKALSPYVLVLHLGNMKYDFSDPLSHVKSGRTLFTNRKQLNKS